MQKLELRNATVTFVPGEATDTGLDTYRVTAFDERFGAELIVAEYVFDNTHEDGFYKERAEFMALEAARWMNHRSKARSAKAA